MKATKLIYQKVYSLPNFQNEKIGIEVEIDETERPSDIFPKMKLWCDYMHNGVVNGEPKEVSEARYIVIHPDDYLGKQVKEAEKIISDFELQKMDDLPF